MHGVIKLFWVERFVFWVCVDVLIQRYVLEVGMMSIFDKYHTSAVGGHHGGVQTAHKISQFS